MDKWWHDCRDTLMRRAISIDRKIGEVEDAIHWWWTERFAAWRLRISRCLVSGQSSGLLIPPSENALTAPIDLRR